ncbi:MAG TPA: response regulator transcription factor [Nitrospira sp.]|jgi:DNA-binding NarL/FixJ family response regulator|nr:response regulator transcription factor [Nitrospira sp.]
MEREGTEIIRILLVDDVEKIRESLRAILATSPHFEIVGEACDGEEAVLAVAQLKPSVVVMDIDMPRLNGIEATAWIRRTYPHVLVVGVSAIATEGICQLMKAAGATTVISKEAVEQLQHAILESIGQGSTFAKPVHGTSAFILRPPEMLKLCRS